jgi:tetratricopeptide (TPR) repeat protein
LLPPATVSDALSGRATPRLEFVIAFVRGCLRYAHDHGLTVEGGQADLAEWRRRWQQVRQEADAAKRRGSRRNGAASPVSPAGPGRVLPPPADPDDTRTGPADWWEAPPPWQLPHAVRWLHGRQSEMAWLDAAILGRGSAAGGPAAAPDTPGDVPAAPIVMLEGMGGVGKSALAVAWGQRRRTAFPDGQLFADLGGYGPGSPADPAHVLAVFVRGLGAMPHAIPSDVDGLAALFRSLCMDRKVLVLLDNASDAEQVRPLLPAAPTVATLVTTRHSLAGLAARHDARRMVVRPLDGPDAVALLRHDLPDTAPDELQRLAAACGNLPLALRLASSRLVSDPQDTELLRVDGPGPASRRLLTALTDASDPYCDLPAVLSWSLSGSSPQEARALLLLSASPGAAMDDHGAAAVIGLPVVPARQLLSALRARHLLERRHHGVWWMHDLVRAWARREADRTLGAAQVREAQRRALGYLLWTADAMDRALLPQRGRPPLSTSLPNPLTMPRISSNGQALAWADAVLPAMLESMSHAQSIGESRFAAALPHIMLSYLNLRKPWPQWLAMCRAGLAAAATLDDPSTTANLHIAAGIAYRETHDLDSAIRSLAGALDAFRRVDNATGVAMTLNNLATVHQESGRPADARQALLEAARELSEGHDRYRRAIVLHNLAEAEIDLGEFDEALHHAGRALADAVAVGDTVGAATTCTTVGRVQALLGHADLAEAEYRAALQVQRDGGDRMGQATTQRHLGRLLIQIGDREQAASHLSQAAAILTELEDPAAAETLRLLHEAEG